MKCIIKVLLALLVLALIVACVPASSVQSPETGFCITGFVGQSVSEPAASETVILLDNATGRPIRRIETNLTGNYQFCSLTPGRYIIRAGDISRTVVIRNHSERLDIPLDDCPICPNMRP